MPQQHAEYGAADPATGERAVVDDRAVLAGDLLADAARIRRAALAVEVTFQAVADGFVQQHAGPAGAEHDAHLAGLGGAGFEVGQRCLDRVIHIALDHAVVEVAEAELRQVRLHMPRNRRLAPGEASAPAAPGTAWAGAGLRR